MGRYWRVLRVAVIATDLVAIIAAHLIAAKLRFGLSEALSSPATEGVYASTTVVVSVAVILVSLGWSYGVYRRWALLGGHRVYPMIVTVATFGLVAVIFLSYFLGGPPVVSRLWLLSSWLGTIVLMTISRLFWRQIALHWQRQGRLVRNVLIAGANQHGIAVAVQLNNPARHGRRVVGFLDDFQRPGTEVVPGISVLGHPSGVVETAREHGVDEFIMIAGALTWESQRQLAELATRPDFPLDARISPTFYDLLTTSAELSSVGYVPLITLMRTRLSGLNAAAKRLMDVSTAAFFLGLLIPAWAWFRVLAWLRGVPMLVQDEVHGFAGRRFEVCGLNRALTTSPVLGRLPALWNVLWHDLSLVGPRPIRGDEVARYERWLSNLVAMRPGLTGLWRLRTGELPVEERVALDLYYVRNYTLVMDAQILFNTGRQLVRRLLSGEATLARWSRVSGARARTSGPAAAAAAAPQAPSAAPPRPGVRVEG